MWTPHQLLPGLAGKVAALAGVRQVTTVVSGMVWLSVPNVPPGMLVPLELAAVDPASYAAFVPAAHRADILALDGDTAILGASSARLRHLGPGGSLTIGGRTLRVTAVLPDADVGAHELLVSRAEAATLGVTTERYLLVETEPHTAWQPLAAQIHSLIPPGTGERVVGPGEARYLRQADSVLTPVEEKLLFGEFAADPQPTRDGLLTVDPAWVSAHIVTEAVPMLGRITCNYAIMEPLRAALAEVEQQGLASLVHAGDFGGCYEARANREDSAALSHHSWGSAIDINVSGNALGETPHQDPRLVDIFAAHGFTWGGSWEVPDGMHFEYLQPPS